MSSPETSNSFQRDRETFERLMAQRPRVETELAKAVVGQRAVIEQILIALVSGGH